VRAVLVAVIAFALLFGGGRAEALRHPGAPRCPVFPASNPWNQRVDRLPVAANSDAIIRSIGPDETMHADFGSGLWEGGPIGIPITVVRRHSRRVAFASPSSTRTRATVAPTRFPATSRSKADGARTATATP